MTARRRAPGRPWLLGLGLTAALGAAGCQAPPVSSRTIHVGRPAPLRDFGLSRTSRVDYAALAALPYEGLTLLDEDGVIRPGLARDWTVDADGRTYVFRLRVARFHDGARVTAADVERSWLAVLRSPPGTFAHAWMLDGIVGALAYSRGEARRIDGLRVLDDSTLSVRLDEAFVPFPALLALPKAAVVGAANDSLHPVGTGPWRWVSGPVAGGPIRFARFDRYWGDAARLDSLELRYVKPGDVVPALASGALDYMQDMNDADRYAIAARADIGLMRSAPLGLTRLIIDFSKPVLRDRRVRLAIAHAIDVRRLAEAVGAPPASIAHGGIPPGMPGFDPARDALAFDPVRARALLQASDYPPGRPLRIWSSEVTFSQEPPRIGALLKSYLEGVGFTVELHGLGMRDSASAATASKLADLSLEQWFPDYADADAMLFPMFHGSVAGTAGNDGRFADPRVDRLIDASRTERDAGRRAALLRQADSIVQADVANVFLWYEPVTAAFALRLGGWRPTAFLPRFTSVAPAAAAN